MLWLLNLGRVDPGLRGKMDSSIGKCLQWELLAGEDAAHLPGMTQAEVHRELMGIQA